MPGGQKHGKSNKSGKSSKSGKKSSKVDALEDPLAATKLKGSDPIGEILMGGIADDRSLLYGMAGPRSTVQRRLQPHQDMIEEATDIKGATRTIDEYNKVIGVNMVMGPNMAAAGLYEIRRNLESTGDWQMGKSGKPVTYEDHLWVAKLRENKDKIGLKDLGGRGRKWGVFSKRDGVKKLKKGRIEKNQKEEYQGKLSATEINDWVSTENTWTDLGSALSELNKLPSEKRSALHDWTQKAFFRRTSKLGIEFATQELGSKVHFNLAANPNFGTEGSKTEAGGIATMADRNDKGSRTITVSEYRHVQRLLAKGVLKPEQVNFYNEFDED